MNMGQDHCSHKLSKQYQWAFKLLSHQYQSQNQYTLQYWSVNILHATHLENCLISWAVENMQASLQKSS